MSDVEADQMTISLARLLESSLALWKRPGFVRRETHGAIVVEADGHLARITRAAPGVPFRWSISIDGRERVAGSVTGLLRQLRSGLDPDFRPSRARIAPIDIAPS